MNAPTFFKPNQPKNRHENLGDATIAFWKSHTSTNVDVSVTFRQAAMKIVKNWDRITVSLPDAGRIYVAECTDPTEGWVFSNNYSSSIGIRFRIPKEDSHIFQPFLKKPLKIKYDNDLGLYYLEVIEE